MANTFKILIFSKDPHFSEFVKQSGLGVGFEWVFVRDMNDLVQTVYDEMPHLIVADIKSSNVGAFDLCNQIKTDAVLEHIALIVLTDTDDPSALMECGAEATLKRDEHLRVLWPEIENFFARARHELDVNPATQLPGSRSSVTRLEELLGRDEAFAILMIHLRDLDRYYERYGIQGGDMFMKCTAEMLREICGQREGAPAFIGHIGVNDYVIVTGTDNSIEYAERIIESFEGVRSRMNEYEGERARISVTLSIAIVSNENTHLQHVSEISQAAEQVHRYLKRFTHSAYLRDRRSNIRESVKGLGRGKPLERIRAQNDLDSLQRKIGISEGLLAEVVYFLRNENVRTHYQPIVDFVTRRVVAYEALTRFEKTDGQMVDPIQIFRASREINLVKELDLLCAMKAIENSGALRASGKLFVNLNRETFLDVDSLAQVLKLMALDLGQLVFEITEQSLLRQLDDLVKSLARLREQGIQIALDDTGGGDVSLREAAQIRPQFVKFDKSLIRDVHRSEMKQKILKSMAMFATNISAITIAEGVERQDEWDFLKGIGIDYAQGYYVAMPAEKPELRFKDAS
ncbi:MAG: EAL domain-containing protein [Candidatus Omnitrophica bacterium]|nr:EAL domain-containing protein [Candidatus Omnitrophota bacterium]